MFPTHVVPQTGGVLEDLVGADGTRGLGLSGAVLVLDVALEVVPVLEDFVTIGTLYRLRRLPGGVVHAVVYGILHCIVVGNFIFIKLLIVIILFYPHRKVDVVPGILHSLGDVLV